MLLQVTAGCSHNNCTFCTMYKDVPFAVSPLEEVEADLREVAAYRPGADRVFLENGDAFALSAEKLEEIAELIHRYLPMVSTITGYARIGNISGKSDAELAWLAALGFDEWNIGLESGLDDVLSFMNKGFTVDEAREQLLRLRKAGISFSLNIINAAAGPAHIHEHAAANAAIVNETQPYLLFVSPLHVDPGSELERIAERGEFPECTLGQYLDEEIEFLEGLQMEDCTFFGLHVSNPVPVLGYLPREKEKLLADLRAGKAKIPRRVLDSHPAKGAEGRLYL